MKHRYLVRSAVAVTVLVWGCGGGAGSTGGDAAAPGDGDPGSASDGRGGASSGVQLFSGQARLAGSFATACSNLQPAAGDRWCAFYVPAFSGASELFVLDVSQSATIALCDGTDPRCLRLTRNLWMAPPDKAAQTYRHRFFGDTLLFYADAPAKQNYTQASVYVWKPGWTDAKKIAGSGGYGCAVYPPNDLVVCYQNSVAGTPDVAQFDLAAGKLGDESLHMLKRIIPQRQNGASQYQVGVAAGGDWLAYSTGGREIEEKETLYAVRLEDIGQPDKVIKVAEGVSRWAIAPDTKKWYWLRDYDYADSGATGTLSMADFPAGTGEIALSPKVASYHVLSDGATGKQGLSFFVLADSTQMVTDLSVMRDRDNPSGVVAAAKNVMDAVTSPDLRYALFFQTADSNLGTFDAHLANIDGKTTCSLTDEAEALFLGKPFSQSSRLAFWARLDAQTGVRDGWYAHADDCSEKMLFASGIDSWFAMGPDAMLFTETVTKDAANLKYAAITDGVRLATPVVIRERIDRLYAILPNRDIVFSVNRGGATTDGLYIATGLGF